MAKLAAGEVERFVAGYSGRPALVLVYGTDEGLVRARARALLAKAAGEPPDPLGPVDLDGDALAADPGRLVDEARSIPLLGGTRVILVRATGRTSIKLFEPLLTSPPEGAVIIVEGGDLSRTAALRTAFEKSADAMAVPCYADTARDLAALIDQRLRENGQTISTDARQSLIAALGADRGLSIAEIDKLSLYAHGKARIDLSDVEAIIADVGASSAHQLVDLAFSGQIAEIETEANRLFREGNPAELVLRAAASHAALLSSALREKNGGRPVDDILRRAGLHFRRQDFLRRHLSLWTPERLDRIGPILHDAGLNTRRTSILTEAILTRALWTIALAAGRGNGAR